MRPTTLTRLCLSAGTAAAAAVVGPSPAHDLRIPTSYESAVLARRILALTPLGTISTVFPDNKEDGSGGDASAQERRPAGLGGLPYGLMEYIADCETDDLGNPTILAVSIGTTFKNAAAGSNVSLAVQWTPPHPPAKRIKSQTTTSSSSSRTERRGWLSYIGLASGNDNRNDNDEDDYYATNQPHHHHPHYPTPLPYSAANLPRFSLLGHLEPIDGGDDREGDIGAPLARCFVATHPDAKYWLPGSSIHDAHFVRLVVEQVYWVGGFGDRAFIGWIPVEEWRNVTRQEWQKARLPGEKKGWKEWSVSEDL